MCIDILNMNFEFMLWITGIMDYCSLFAFIDLPFIVLRLS